MNNYFVGQPFATGDEGKWWSGAPPEVLELLRVLAEGVRRSMEDDVRGWEFGVHVPKLPLRCEYIGEYWYAGGRSPRMVSAVTCMKSEYDKHILCVPHMDGVAEQPTLARVASVQTLVPDSGYWYAVQGMRTWGV